MTVTGEILAGEAAAAAGSVRRRFGPAPWLISIVVMAVLIAGGMVGVALGWVFRAPYSSNGWFFIGGVVVTVIVLRPFERRWRVAQFRKQLTKLDQPVRFPLQVELTDEALVHRLGDVTTTAAWPAVAQILRARAYWVFVIQAGAAWVPRRCFTETGAEQAFISGALSRMSENARARSPEAVKFAGG